MDHFHDDDEWETFSESRPCTSCDGDMKRCNGRCNGSFSTGTRRRPAEEVSRIKAERRRAEEDRILAEAEAIKARRKAPPTPERPMTALPELIARVEAAGGAALKEPT